MKSILFLFLLIMPCFGHAQNVYDISLSKTLDESRMGQWTNGDYTIHIELSSLETSFRNVYKSYAKDVLNQSNKDSVSSMLYKLSAERYLSAANQLKEAKNRFDLRSLVVYFGQDNAAENLGSSAIVGAYIKQFVETGNAAVFYKGTRVFTLKNQHKYEGEGLNFGYEQLIYFDSEESYAFKAYQHLGW